MPHLKLLHRTWKYSEDEFVISSLAQMTLRIILNGRVKYQFYQTFLYGEETLLDDEEKAELIRQIREIGKFSLRDFLCKKFAAAPCGDTEDDRNEAIDAVASALTDFSTDLDLTMSDLSVALILLRWQSDQWISGQGSVSVENVLKQTFPDITNIAAPLDPCAEDPMDKLESNWLHISRLRRYSKLVNASYGWIYYVLNNPCSCIALNRLCKRLSCGNPTAPDRQIDFESGIMGPGGCLCAGKNCYLSAFLEMSQLKTENILTFQITDQAS
ncbi:unnamed protein product [Rodentolepis nana]|uniref:BACK domain-containing protein n=1 Tax=Rodentolepis nana TaxID=102285 RepID=A0A0R3T1G9_RODNA|nr:unnamed protein product [Rodentolepis nana]